jgi:hypothetical protein
MAKQQCLFLFIDTRDSTKRIHSDVEYFEEFVSSTLNFVLGKFNSQRVFSECQCKPLGDGFLIYYKSKSNLRDDPNFENLLKGVVSASVECISGYNNEMHGRSPKGPAKDRKYQLGISIGSGYLYDFHYEAKSIEIEDVGSIDLTYVFRLNQFAKPEGIVVEENLYESYKDIFDQCTSFKSKRKRIDNVFGEKLIYISKEVEIGDEENDLFQTYRMLGDFSVKACKDIIRLEIAKKKLALSAPPEIRFMLFKCDGKDIQEAYNLYINLAGGKPSTFPVLSRDEVKKDEKYPHLIYKCYYEKEIAYFSYSVRYVKNTDRYIQETRREFYVAIDDPKIREFFDNLSLKPSSALAIPILDKGGDVRWIVALDTEETRVFKESFFDHLGLSIRTFFETQIEEKLKNAEKSVGPN